MKIHAPDEYYHIYNRGMQKQPIFISDADRLRFLFILLTFQGTFPIKNITRTVKQSVQSRTLHINEDIRKEIIKDRAVELVCFCLMPNHFHLIVRENTEGGIARYMQRVLTAYTKYFNIRHEKSGHLFQGSYKSVLVEDDIQLMHLSAYIHKNPSEINGFKNKEHQYTWSSYQDCLETNRFESLLSTGIISDRYNNNREYKKFVESSLAKEKQI